MVATAQRADYSLPYARPLMRGSPPPQYFQNLKKPLLSGQNAGWRNPHDKRRLYQRRIWQRYYFEDPKDRYAENLDITAPKKNLVMPGIEHASEARRAKIAAQGKKPPAAPKAVTAPVGGKMASSGGKGLMRGAWGSARRAINSHAATMPSPSAPSNSVNRDKREIYQEHGFGFIAPG